MPFLTTNNWTWLLKPSLIFMDLFLEKQIWLTSTLSRPCWIKILGDSGQIQGISGNFHIKS